MPEGYGIGYGRATGGVADMVGYLIGANWGSGFAAQIYLQQPVSQGQWGQSVLLRPRIPRQPAVRPDLVCKSKTKPWAKQQLTGVLMACSSENPAGIVYPVTPGSPLGALLSWHRCPDLLPCCGPDIENAVCQGTSPVAGGSRSPTRVEKCTIKTVRAPG